MDYEELPQRERYRRKFNSHTENYDATYYNTTPNYTISRHGITYGNYTYDQHNPYAYHVNKKTCGVRTCGKQVFCDEYCDRHLKVVAHKK